MSPWSVAFQFLLLLLILAAASPFQIKDVIRQVSIEKEISTIAFFGHSFALEPALQDVNESIPRMVYTESFGELYFGDSFNKNILIVACINLWQRSMLNRIDVAFREINAASRSIYLVHQNRYKNLRHLAEHFQWCWTKGFVNVLVIFTQTNETFSYTLFPEMRIIWQSLDETIFPNRFQDLMGFAIRSPLQDEPPRVFEYRDSWGKSHLTGYCADLFLAFLKTHNATMKVVRRNNSTKYDIPDIVYLIREGLVDLSIHTYIDFEGVRSSYPLRMMQWCILVPFSGEIGAYWYFIRPFQTLVWLSCLGTLIAISLYVSVEEHRRGMTCDVGRSWCEVFRQMLGLPFTDNRPCALYRALRRALVFAFGFMLTNLYLAYLTSFLAKIIYEPQIQTLAELVTKNISIITRDFEIPVILRNRGLPPGFDRLLVSTSNAQLMNLRVSGGNQSFAFTTTDDKAAFVLVQQKHLRQPLFNVVAEAVSTVPMGFLMAKHSPFEGILNRFILRANAAGLLLKWWNDMFLNGMKAGLLKVLHSTSSEGEPLTIEHFQFAWIALGGGLALASICAIFERVLGVVGKFKVVLVYRG